MTKTMDTPPKSQSKKPIREITEELMKSQIYLFQLCHDQQQKLAAMELEMQKMSQHADFIMEENEELKNFLGNMSRKLMSLKKDLPNQSGAQEGAPNIPSGEAVPKIQKKIGKPIPLHDDVSITCEMCSHVYHINQKACPKCNFNKIKKEGE
jgi:superfamily II helicase